MVRRTRVGCVAAFLAGCAGADTTSAPPRVHETAAVPERSDVVAAYVDRMHDRIHPEFADKELPKLATLPADDPSRATELVTRIRLKLRPEDGSIASVEITEASGVAAFDAAALESVRRAQPFGPPPRAMTAADGNVYLDWDLHRDPILSCSTKFARPFVVAPR